MITKIGTLGGVLLALVMGGAITSFAQEEQQAPDGRVIIRREQGPEVHVFPPSDRVMIEQHVQEIGPPPKGDFIFMATEMSFGGKRVKGAPYSAQAVTENTQTLADGNRIVYKTTANVYRDSEGRTRREQTLKAIGPFAKSGEPHQAIFINDPVAGTSYTLHPQERIARKMPPMRFKMSTNKVPREATAGQVKVETATGATLDAAPGVKFERPDQFEVLIEPDVVLDKKATEAGVAFGWIGTRNENARFEDLGKQNIEGVEAEGKRTIVTIPAGEIGNERPIEIVSERWYSPELQAIVMTRHTDPRFGENTYKLTNINRSEPAKMLFEVPADYTVKEGPPMKGPMRMPKPVSPPQE